MDPELKTIAQETFDHLPQDIQEVIFADDYLQILSDISKKYNLTVDQQNKLEFQTTMVLMGMDRREYFMFDLELEVGLEEDVAEAISTEINETIFATVEDSLTKINQEDAGTEEELNAKLDYEEKRLEIENTENNTSASTSLNSLSDRLKQASIATPMRNNLSFDMTKTNTSTTESTETPRPAIDPYHESIDNE